MLNADAFELMYQNQRAVFLHAFDKPINGYLLDLGALSMELADVFLRWMTEINYERISHNEQPIMTLELAMKCPLWKVVDPPIRRISLTQEGMFNQPSVRGAFGTRVGGGINRSSKRR